MRKSIMNLSNTKLLTCDQGNLVPIGLMDVSPGDTFRHDTSLLIRTQPLLAPVMHKCTVTIHHWFVPLRLVHEEFEEFITGGIAGNTTVQAPTIDSPVGGFDIGTLADFLGLPVGVENMEVSALPFRAYGLIYNNFYLDQQLQTPVEVSLASGVDTTTSTDLQNAAWMKDYFTSARPQPQLGAEVTIPLTGDAPVLGFGNNNNDWSQSGSVTEADGNAASYTEGRFIYADSEGPVAGRHMVEKHPDHDGPHLRADLSNVSAVSLSDLRLAAAIQRFKEKANRGGARYVEWLQSFFKSRAQDQRLQIPQYIGGGRATLQFSEVLNTADTTEVGGDPVGTLKGHGIAAGKSNRYKFHAPEHGFIISLMCVRPKTMYTQGQHRLWNRRSRYDYLIPDLANLSDQEIENREIYAAHTDPTGTFGFAPRYDDYRTIPNTIAGDFRDSLDFWHLGREFVSDPALNSDFITANPTDRVYATDEDQLQIQVLNTVKVKRCLPKYAKPYLY
ncbi:major capsid protein [Microviridae sp.]|nr:major capsid protein [Microviridae sp.]